MKLEGATKAPDLAFIALGSNLGDSSAILGRALERLQMLSDRTLLQSSCWRTTPVDCPPGSPLFLNAMAGLVPRAEETPETLLITLQQLEKEFGRALKKTFNEPRPLDLDLIAFGRHLRATPQLTLPHPRAHLRAFVLAPLNEIAPDYTLPLQTRTVGELLADLLTTETITRLP